MPSRESQSVGRRIEVAGLTALGDAVAATRRYASDHLLGPRDEARLCIIVEELITNLIEHGGADIERPIGIDLGRARDAVTLVIEDEGRGFDPRDLPDGNTIPDRGGGAGLRLVAAWSEVVGYERDGGRNRLKLVVPLSDR